MEGSERSTPRVLARLLAVSSTVFALAAGAHVAGGGALPVGQGLAVLVSLTVAASAVLARRRLRLPTLLVAAAAGQWLLHQAFSLAAARTAATSSLTSGGHAGHGSMDPSLLASMVARGHHHGTSNAMLAAHAAATVATVLLLVATERGTERALDRWAWARPVLLLGPVLPVRPEPATSVDAPVARLHTLWAAGAVGSRAPPVVAVAVV